jgi:hypothetical protein
MNTVLTLLLLAAMGATAYVLIRGVMAMASGKDISGERQQDYMRKRVLFQAIAIIIVILILVVAGASGR